MITLWLSKWFILTIAVVGGLLTGMLGFSRPALYEAKAQLIASSPNSTAAPGASAVSQESINETIDSHLTRLLSQAQLRRAISMLNSHGEKAALAALRERGRSTGLVSTVTITLRGWMGDLRRLLKIGDQSSMDDFPVDVDAELLAALRSGMRVGQELRSRVISIGFTDTDRVTASIVVNTYAQAYVEQLTNQSRTSYERDLAEVESRIPEMQRDLADSIEKKENYLIAMGGGDQASADAAIQEISQLKKLLSETKAKRSAANARLAGGTNSDLTDPFEPAIAEGINTQSNNISGLQSLAASKIQQEDYRPDKEAQLYETQIASLQERIGALETMALQTATRLSGLRALELEIGAESNRYNDILEKRETLRQHAKAPTAGVSILSAAWPPTDPKTMSAIFLVPPGTIFFGLLAAIIAVLWHSFEDTMRSDEESEQGLGIPSAGMLPKLSRPTAKGIQQLILGHQNSPYRRALSSIFVALAPHHANAKFSKLVLVTSSTQSDGKTELAWSLAVSAKRFGHRVLLIDLDTREHRLTRSFRYEVGVATAANNFADFVEARGTLQDAVINLPKVGIDFMPAPADSADLLARLTYVGIQDGFDKLRQEYSFVIVNGPTGAEAPEVRLLAAQADAVLFAICWGKTKRSLARAALKIFTRDSGDATIISSVLTNVNLRQQKRYRFGDSADLLRSNP